MHRRHSSGTMEMCRRLIGLSHMPRGTLINTNIEDTLMGESARDQPLQDSGFSHVL